MFKEKQLSLIEVFQRTKLSQAIFQSDNEWKEEEKKFLRQKLFKINPHR